MTTETKTQIRERIARAGGFDIGAVHPELFIGDTYGALIAQADNTKRPWPHMMVIAVPQIGSDAVPLGVYGCN